MHYVVPTISLYHVIFLQLNCVSVVSALKKKQYFPFVEIGLNKNAAGFPALRIEKVWVVVTQAAANRSAAMFGRQRLPLGIQPLPASHRCAEITRIARVEVVDGDLIVTLVSSV